MDNRILVVLSVLLAACGGGGGGGSTASGGPSGPNLADGQAANPGETRSASARAAVNLPRFGSVTQSSNAGDVAGVTGDAASASFDGRNVRLAVERTDGSQIVLDAATDRLGSENYEHPLSGYSYRGDALQASTDRSVSIAGIYTISNDANPTTDYIAAGYWLHLEGNAGSLPFTGAEIGAFVDGPEISGPATLPGSGTATYSGSAEGFFATQGPGQAVRGTFTADAELEANFRRKTVSGCIGCNGGAYVSGVRTYANGRTEDLDGDHESARLRLGATPIGSDGSFRDRNVTLEHDDAIVTGSSGSWGGRFSNVPTLSGDPRLVAGTVGVEATAEGGVRSVLVGAWAGIRDQ